jgi:cytochrome P450
MSANAVEASESIPTSSSADASDNSSSLHNPSSSHSSNPVDGRAPRRSGRLELLDAVAAMDVPFVQHEIANRPVVFVNDPELIAQVLHAHAASFEKSEFQKRVMGVAEGSETGLGNGMLTSSNAVNKQQRKLLGRIFSPAAMQRHVRAVAALARDERDRWADGSVVELGEAFMRLSTRVVARTLFSWDLGADDERIADDLATIGSLLGRSASQRRAGWEDPSLIERAGAFIEERLLALVEERRRRGGPVGEATDVIDLLLHAQAEGAADVRADVNANANDNAAAETYVVTDRQIRDDLLTLFITGAENPRNALTWALHLLTRHPEAAQRIRDEVRAAGADVTAGDVTLETLPRLPYTLQVFKEALRLYPPGYAFGRRAIADVRIGRIDIAAGTEVVISPYALHRRASLFDRPLDFDPTRFEKNRESERHQCAFLPFGVGPRGCIGGGFALMEGHTILAVLLGSLRFVAASNTVVHPEPRMTLRPAGAVSVIVRRNEAHV